MLVRRVGGVSSVRSRSPNGSGRPSEGVMKCPISKVFGATRLKFAIR